MIPYYTGPVTAKADRPWRRRLPVMLTAAAVAFVAALSPLAIDFNHRAALAATTTFTPVPGAPASFAPLAERVLPTVVTVATVQGSGGENLEGPAFPDLPPGSPLEKFFRRFLEPHGQPGQGMPGPAPQPAPKVQGLGSGFIVDADGTIVTNNHVVAGAEKIAVVLHDGERLDAKLIGTDPKTDLAVIKIDTKKKLAVATFGDSDTAKVGNWVLAVGNPFGLGGTVTAGVISARSRFIGSGPFDDYLQIDASINRGNSGGPTFDMSGNVVGVNTAIFSPNGGSVGIGFAIPANIAKNIVEQLKEHGQVRRAWMGVQVQEVTPDIAASIGLDKPEGALVVNVIPESPAAKAGVKSGDVLLLLDETAIDKMRSLPRLVADSKIDTTHKVVLWRDGKKMDVAVTLTEMKDEPEIAAADEPAQPKATSGKLGLALAALAPETRERFRISESVSGVVVTDVRQDGPAAEKGVRPGDVIVKVGPEMATSPQIVTDAVTKADTEKRHAVLLLINRNGTDRFVAIPLPRA